MKFGMRYADVTNSRGRKQITWLEIACCVPGRRSMHSDCAWFPVAASRRTSRLTAC